MGGQLVLVVDDDEAICDTVEDGLHLAGYRTVRASDGARALELVRDLHPDLVVLDVNMPRIDGFKVLRRLRDTGSEVPIIVLTARHDRADVVNGLKLGADDYVYKPFGLEELLLRVSAVLRRGRTVQENVLRCGPVTVDLDAHEVRSGSRLVELSPTEFRLLTFLMERKNKVASKDQILSAVWNIDFESGTTVVETFVSYLRKKLSPEAGQLIKTIRGVGFKMTETP